MIGSVERICGCPVSRSISSWGVCCECLLDSLLDAVCKVGLASLESTERFWDEKRKI